MDIVVVGGGTGTNAILPVFPPIARNICYVVPISDNGGSTSEILRVLGGPAIGDARSRLVRLMPEGLLKQTLAFRLPEEQEEARKNWADIVEGRHQLWRAVPNHHKHMYRAFLIRVHSEILLRNRPGNEFKFGHASIGNLLLTGARIFFGSLDSAIEFVLSTSRVEQRFSVLPAVNTNFTHHLAAVLEDGSHMVGQTEISHPADVVSDGDQLAVDFEDAMPFNHPSLSASQISFSKDAAAPLPSKLDRVYYINPMGAEIKPKPATRLMEAVSHSRMIVYSVGSLYTSIIPVILLQGFAAKVRNMAAKVLMLNGAEDRETTGMSACDHIRAVVRASLYSMGSNTSLIDAFDWTQFVSHMICPPGQDIAELEERGIKCIECGVDENNEYLLDELEQVMREITAEASAAAAPVTGVAHGHLAANGLTSARGGSPGGSPRVSSTLRKSPSAEARLTPWK